MTNLFNQVSCYDFFQHGIQLFALLMQDKSVRISGGKIKKTMFLKISTYPVSTEAITT